MAALTALAAFAVTLSGCSRTSVDDQGGFPLPAGNTALREPELTTIEVFPEPAQIDAVILVPGLNAAHGGKVTGPSFKHMIATANAIEPSDPSVDAWAYAPWYSGSFMTPEGLHRFELYLGGRGRLMMPDGRAGLFLFEPQPAPRD